MRTPRNIQDRIALLEQRVLPQRIINRFLCFVDAGADRDKVVEKFRLDNNVQDDDKLIVLQYVSPEFPPKNHRETKPVK